ncbi:MAG: hypothetical protein U0821_14265 [Chloroflexota bacterium]
MPTDWPVALISGSQARPDDIITLRSRIDIIRQNLTPTLPPVSWSPPSTGQTSPFTAQSFIQMRTAIQEIWTAKGMPVSIGPWTGDGPGGPSTNPPSAQTRIRAAHINNLRTWLNQAEGYPALVGIQTHSYDPNNGQLPIPGDNWVNDIRGLSSKITMVRCTIVARQDTNNPGQRMPFSLSPTDLDGYYSAFDYYRDRGLTVFAVLNSETYYRGEEINAPRRPADLSNDYIEHFSDAAAYLSERTRLWNAGVQNFIIWNEPNDADPTKYLSSDCFAALLRRCWKKMAVDVDARFRPNIYWGGVLFTNVEESQPQDGQIEYLQKVYDAVASQIASGVDGSINWQRSWPWRGINVHIHHRPDPTFLLNLFKDINATRSTHGDPNELLVGEWGATKQDIETVDPNMISLAYTRLRPYASHMFYYLHPHVPDRGADWGTRNTGVAVEAGQNRWQPLTQNDSLYSKLQAALA